jgi:hypothetical protein
MQMHPCDYRLSIAIKRYHTYTHSHVPPFPFHLCLLCAHLSVCLSVCVRVCACVYVCVRVVQMGQLCVNGKVEAGTLRKNDKVIIMPAKLTTEIIEILVDEVAVDMVKPGENVLVKLKTLEEEDLHQGFVICAAEAPCKKTQVFDAQIAVLELLPHKPYAWSPS